MDATSKLSEYINSHQPQIGRVVDFNPESDKLYAIDLTKNNPELSAGLLADINAFNNWVANKLAETSCRYAAGGYLERRTIYESRALFEGEAEPRSVHLGIDIWGPPGTPVYAPLSGTIHSFQDNDNYGDYGPTIIMQHDLNGLTLYSLFGHLSRKSLTGISIGQNISINQKIAQLGAVHENGSWPPHLHFQLMFDMEGKQGDYPGVCRVSEKEKYLQNIPDPNLLLQFPLDAFMK
jgi:murein DD-endopeptidase MepM/ murein hydrolase activator NlpD